AHDSLGLEVFLETQHAIFAAVTRAFVATEGRVSVPGGVVDVDLPGADPQREATRALEILRLHMRPEPIHRVIRDAYSVFLVAVRDDGEHGSEDFLARNPHLGRHSREDRRTDVKAALQALRPAGTATEQAGAFIDSGGNHRLNAAILRRVRDRAEGR